MFNRISYLEEELQELNYLELRAKPLKNKYIPYSLFNGIIHTKLSVIQILEEAL